MSESPDGTDQPEPDPQPLTDPSGLGPETIDGTRPPGTVPTGPGSAVDDDPEPGDPELHADPEDAPTS